jgi:peptide/nickel transport system substrate-binding protein
MLMNRELMQDKVFRCIGKITSGPYFYRTPFYDQSIQPWPYDPARAKALLAEAGWKDVDGDGVLEKDGIEFRFELSFTAAVREWQQVAELYQQDLKKAGIDMVIRTLEWAVFSQNVQEWKFDACAMSWALIPYPDEYVLFHSSQADVQGSQNYEGYKNPEVDRLIELNRAEFDVQKRIEYAHQIHRLLHEDQPVTFLFTGERLTVVSNRFHNIKPKALRPCVSFYEWYVPAGQQKYKAAPGP